jgi:hypothetical protein
MIMQLRVYTINKGKMDKFVKGWVAGWRLLAAFGAWL